MISRYSQIQQQVAQLSEILKAPGHVQKIHSTAWYLCFQIRLPGRTFYLYLGRGGGHEGLWISETPSPAGLRLRDTWLEWCRKNLSSALLQSATVDPTDRAIRLRFSRAGHAQDFYILWAGRTSYFAFHNTGENEWFTSWGGKPAEGFSVFDDVGRKHEVIHPETAPPIPPIEKLLEIEKAQLDKSHVPKGKLKSLKVKIGKIQGDITKIKTWKPFQEWLGEQDPAIFENEREMKFQELKYKFPPGLTGWQKRDWLYGQAKRLKIAELHQEGRLKATEIELERLINHPPHEESTLKPIRPVWKAMSADKKAVKETGDDYDIHNFDNYRIGVGKSAVGNDQLRKLWGKPDDLWVHAAHGTSAHAIIKLSQPGHPGPEQIKEAAILIAKRSGSEAGELEVIVALVKNVRGVPGAAGMVTYKKNKTLLCVLR